MDWPEMSSISDHLTVTAHRTIGLGETEIAVESSNGVEIGDIYGTIPHQQNYFVVTGIPTHQRILVQQVVGADYIKEAIEIDKGTTIRFIGKHPTIKPVKIELS